MRSNHSDLCICCGKTPVTWPRVCADCRDAEAQAELAEEYGVEFVPADPHDPDGSTVGFTGYECRTCGMIYDGGMSCSYCGDPDPLDSGESE